MRRCLRQAFGGFAIAGAILGFCLAAAPCVSSAQAQTVVSLTFDDGIATQNLTRPVLASHGMHGTFYVNSGLVGANSYYTTWPDVDALAADGNEIGGHTLTHQRLTDLTADQQRHQICDDAANLRGRGYTVTDFAYPYGSGSKDANVRQALQDCGYQSARIIGDLYGPDCTTCPYAESIPPKDPLRVRDNDWLARAFTLQDMQGWVTQAEDHGGGWVPVYFHDICNACDESSVTLADFTAFLDWLQPRAANGTVVKTVREVISPPPPATYVRPKGATPLRVSLVPAYLACDGTSADSSHGEPLAFPSCDPPLRSSSRLTVGTPDANGRSANAAGFVRLETVSGDPSTPADEADVELTASMTDVREASDLSDYPGELDARATIRLTDKLNGAASNEAGTVGDFDLDFAVPCAATADALVGASCAVSTTADAITPGMAPERTRAIWGLGQVRLLDGGPDGLAATAGNETFAVQGVFVP